MSLFQWGPRYDLGVPDMNREHQRLIELMNQLYGLHEAKASKVQLVRALAALADYTKTHFAHEEAYMAKIDYPERKVHEIVHKNLLDKLAEHQRDYNVKGVLTDDFFTFLKRWLAAHILGIDMKYSKHAHHGHAPHHT